MNEGEMINESELPEIEVVEREKESQDVDLGGQVRALETEIDALETKYDESDEARIKALKKQKADLEQALNS